MARNLAEALFFTACRFHEWALLTKERLVRDGEGKIIAARLCVKGGKHRDAPVMLLLEESLAA